MQDVKTADFLSCRFERDTVYDMFHQAAVSQLKRDDTIQIVEQLIYLSRLATGRE